MNEPHRVSLGFQSPALLATCPICGRPRGQVCCDPRGNARWGRPHRTRLKAALALPPGEGVRRNDKGNPLQVYHARQAAGWTTNANGWVAPDGTSEDDWATEGYPFPEEPGFAEWFSAFHHYQALDEDRPSPTSADAFPHA